MLRLANYQVTVYGANQPSDGASHKAINMRHLSATETTAKPLHNHYLLAANHCLAVECNRAGIELFEKLMVDNPSLARFARERIGRAIAVSGCDVEFAPLMHELEMLLQRSGVQFVPQLLSPEQIAQLSREHFVVSAMGVEQPEIGDEGAGQGIVWGFLVQELIQAKHLK